MKNTLLLAFLFLVTAAATIGQSPVKATIRLKNGKTIEAWHFGKLTCESNRYAENHTILRGKFQGSHTEIRDYKDISKLVLSGFTDDPVASVGNQKATITAVKTTGVSVTLDDAELAMSCFGPSDRYNEIHVQIINPLTNEKADMAVATKDIESVTFK